MAIAGFCDSCQQYVWLNDQWGCVNGHAWNQIRNWYDPATGAPVTPYWLQPQPAAAVVAPVAAPQPAAQAAAVAPAVAPEPVPVTPPAPAVAPAPAPVVAPVVAPEPQPVPAPAAGSRLEVLAAILGLLGTYPNYRAQYGTDTDIAIDNQVTDSAWAGGKKKVEYQAMLKAVEQERTIYFWEVLKEKSSGLSFGSIESESYTTVGKKRSGTTSSTTFGPGGVVAQTDWDYGVTRQIVESVALPAGWQVKVVLKKKSAQW